MKSGFENLVEACKANDIERIKKLINGTLFSKGVDIHRIDDEGNTILHYAAYQKNEVLKHLVEMGVEVNKKNKRGKTPLHNAVMGGNRDNVLTLMYYRSDVNTKDEDGNTALHLAKNNAEIVKILIENGAEANSKNNEGNTPLHVAAANNTYDIVNILIDNGANINLKNKNHFTPLDVAEEEENVKIAELLKSKGGQGKLKPIELYRIRTDKIENSNFTLSMLDALWERYKIKRNHLMILMKFVYHDLFNNTDRTNELEEMINKYRKKEVYIMEEGFYTILYQKTVL